MHKLIISSILSCFVASGNHSPIGSINGGTMSPNLLVNSSVSQQLPPACGARQLSKLKRFLTTLQQFGSDISPEIGERVRTLVLALVVSENFRKGIGIEIKARILEPFILLSH